MARIINVNLPDQARLEYALTLIYGIGWKRSADILDTAKLPKSTRVKDLSDEMLKKLQDIIENGYKVEGDLKEELSFAMRRLKDINSYRGSRHSKGLPAHGQRTRSNARTKRGKRKTVGALKKEDMAKLTAAAAQSKK